MKYTNKITRVNKVGKIRIPLDVLKQVGIELRTPINFAITKNGISIQKAIFTCMVTGETSADVVEILPGIFLSEAGMKKLLQQLQEFKK